MADLAAYNVSPVFTHITEIRSGLGNAGYGQSVYLDPTTGIYLPTTAATAGKYAFWGIVTSQPVGFPGNMVMDVAAVDVSDHGC